MSKSSTTSSKEQDSEKEEIERQILSPQKAKSPQTNYESQDKKEKVLGKKASF